MSYVVRIERWIPCPPTFAVLYWAERDGPVISWWQGWRDDWGNSLTTTITLAAYSIRLKDRAAGDYLPLGAYLRNDFADIFMNYLDSRSVDPGQNEDQQRMIRVRSFNRTGRTISGLFESGDYGYTSELLNIDSGTVSYRRQTNDAELLPFYFLVWIPTNEPMAILLLQRFRQFGVRGAFWLDFYGAFPHASEIVLQLNPLIDAELFDEVIGSADLRRLRFIKHSLSPDITDSLFDNSVDEDDGTLEFSISAKRGGRFPMLQSLLDAINGDRALTGLLEFPDFDYNTIKLELEVDGHRRTIDLSRPGAIRPYYDVTAEVEFDDSGHPSFASIHGAAEDLLAQLRARVGAQP